MITQLPAELRRLIGTYLAPSDLIFFAMTNKQILKAIFSLLEELQAILLSPPHLILKGAYDTTPYACRCDKCSQLEPEFTDLMDENPCIVEKSLNALWNKSELSQLAGTIKQIAFRLDDTGEAAVVLTSEGLYVHGTNHWRELGTGNNQSADYGFTLIKKLPTNIQQIILGLFHTVMLTTDGVLYVCGGNDHGQLGLGDQNSHTTFTRVTNLPPGIIQQITVGCNHTVVRTSQGWFVCGKNQHGELGLGDQNDRTTFTRVSNLPGSIRQIVVGSSHSIALTSEGLYACGDNEFGQLGIGEHGADNKRTTFTRVNHNLPDTILQIGAGDDYTLVLTNQGLFSCGSNQYDQLMLDDEKDRDIFTFIKNPPSKIKQRLLFFRQIEVLKLIKDESLNIKKFPAQINGSEPLSKRQRL